MWFTLVVRNTDRIFREILNDTYNNNQCLLLESSLVTDSLLHLFIYYLRADSNKLLKFRIINVDVELVFQNKNYQSKM